MFDNNVNNAQHVMYLRMPGTSESN